MYAYINGELETVTDEYIIIDLAGIGYEIICPNPLRFQERLNQKVKVYTYFYVREDQQLLYGFKEQEEKELFKKLLNVSGIGPKNALSIVGQTSAHDFAVAIEQENDTYLTKFPGVGKKTARQMILDLKGKVQEWMYSDGATETDVQQVPHGASGSRSLDEAVEALMALGYSKRETDEVRTKLHAYSDESTDDLVKKGLQILMR
ncbi:Holliday junction branch migration protein RuvA [Halalkalibacillus halophilus]|uniref:Holliday junction branch migration protein RuvA n=1 Tax=Halalkalibacillus halophilus TaxID=392827 RepID=UPI000410E43D|nr:Holliday junction branch migration protein RuvA [Halalkalibacillus halophilus]